MNHVQLLRHSPDFSRVPAIQPGLPALRSADHPAHASLCHGHHGVLKTQDGGATRLGGAWPQRGGYPFAGEGPFSHCTDWPGKGFGIRGPADESETPLSWSEVEIALRSILQ